MADPIYTVEDENCPDDDFDPEFVIEDELSSSGDDQDGPSDGSESERPKVYDYEELGYICDKIGLSPEMIDGIIVQLIARHLSDPDWFIFQELGDIRWDPDPQRTQIWLRNFATWDAAAGENVPAIIYNNLGQQPQRIAIGDQFYHDSRRPEASGYARAYSGTHRIMCIGATEGQSSMLASELSQWLTEFSPWITQRLPFHDFQVQRRESPRLYDELGDRVGVAFGLSYSYIWTWELVPAGPPTKGARLRLNH